MQGGAPCSPCQRGDRECPHDGRAILMSDIQKNADQRERTDNRRTNAAAIIENFTCTTEHAETVYSAAGGAYSRGTQTSAQLANRNQLG